MPPNSKDQGKPENRTLSTEITKTQSLKKERGDCLIKEHLVFSLKDQNMTIHKSQINDTKI
jgi:hypothetical protein